LSSTLLRTDCGATTASVRPWRHHRYVKQSHTETPFRQARMIFWRTVLGDWRAWLCVALCGAGGLAGGAYFAWGHGRGGVVAWTFLWAVIGIVVALLLIFLTLWATTPHRMLRAQVATLAEQVDTLTVQLQEIANVGKPEAIRTEQIRIALYAVRSELGACATRMVEAEQVGKWWDPETDPLPAEQWRRHFEVLTYIPDALNTEIDLTYQKCDRLNHRARGYVEEIKSRTPWFPVKPRPTELLDEDRELIEAARRKITSTNRAISDHLGHGVGSEAETEASPHRR